MKIEKIWSSNIAGYSNVEPGEQSIRLEKINLLIGPNNSGKSRLLRFLFSSPKKNMKFAVGKSLQEVTDTLGDVLDVIKRGINILDFNANNFLEIYRGQLTDYNALISSIGGLQKLLGDAANKNTNYISGDNLNLFRSIKNSVLANNPKEAIDGIAALHNKINLLKRHYIPMLRGMRPLIEGQDLFYERTAKDYFSSAKGSEFEIITGFNLYKLLAQYLLGQPNDRRRVREYEKILGDEFFGGAEVTLIPEYGRDTVAVKIGDDDQFPIYDLGDGLQQVIIITSAAYLEQESSIFFIEEPELCLHPGLLRKLALFLLSHTNHQYMPLRTQIICLTWLKLIKMFWFIEWSRKIQMMEIVSVFKSVPRIEKF